MLGKMGSRGRLGAGAVLASLALAAGAAAADRGDHRSREVRSLDGSGNNPHHPDMGAAFTPLLRSFDADYGDGVSSLAGEARPGPREVSNAVSAQASLDSDRMGPSDYFWQWGQFIDHDIDLSEAAHPEEPADIEVPAGDAWFDPGWTGTASIHFDRTVWDPDTGTDAENPREQLNQISTWLDASMVYGSDAVRARALRRNDGSGMLRTSHRGLLPFNTDGLPNAGGPGDHLFLAGDVRANEQVALTALHTLFVREHNRLAREIRGRHPWMSGEKIYQAGRRLVGALIQAITYREFLPVLLGPDALPPYRGYDPDVDASIANAFSTAAYRFGHSALSPKLLRLNRRGLETRAGHLPLRDAFFDPTRITEEGGIAPILRGLAAQVCQRVDVFLVDDVRNFLFGPPGAGGMDLASLNIQRGRDHGLPGYNDAREALGLGRLAGFDEFPGDPDMREKLASVYDSIDDVDLWAGGLAEEVVPGAQLGPTFHEIVADQFQALRDGDRFWYQRVLSRRERREIQRTRLSDVIRRNTRIGRELRDDVFRAVRR